MMFAPSWGTILGIGGIGGVPKVHGAQLVAFEKYGHLAPADLYGTIKQEQDVFRAENWIRFDLPRPSTPPPPAETKKAVTETINKHSSTEIKPSHDEPPSLHDPVMPTVEGTDVVISQPYASQATQTQTERQSSHIQMQKPKLRKRVLERLRSGFGRLK